VVGVEVGGRTETVPTGCSPDSRCLLDGFQPSSVRNDAATLKLPPCVAQPAWLSKCPPPAVARRGFGVITLLAGQETRTMNTETDDARLPSSLPGLTAHTIGALLTVAGASGLAVLTGLWEALSKAILPNLEGRLLLNTVGCLLAAILLLLWILCAQWRRISGLEDKWKDFPIIHQAKYGFGDDWRDATEAVIRCIHDGVLDVTSGNHLVGDPHHGHSKDLVIDYSVGGISKHAAIPEGATRTIPEKRR
jgi:hypothetical protein